MLDVVVAVIDIVIVVAWAARVISRARAHGTTFHR